MVVSERIFRKSLLGKIPDPKIAAFSSQEENITDKNKSIAAKKMFDLIKKTDMNLRNSLGL